MPYFENLMIRNKKSIDKDGYTVYYYEDYFMEQWVGNINVCVGETNLYHATVDGYVSDEEMLKHLEYVKNLAEKSKWKS